MPNVETLAPDAPSAVELQFGPYRLMGPHGPLLQSGQVVELARKPLAILWLLASRAGEVVHKDELLTTVWPRVVVSEGVIATCMRELRQALGDDARAPRFVATAHRIGYRFIEQVTGCAAPTASTPADLSPLPATPSLSDALVGRSAECALLAAAYQRAVAGQREIVFVTGDRGHRQEPARRSLPGRGGNGWHARRPGPVHRAFRRRGTVSAGAGGDHPAVPTARRRVPGPAAAAACTDLDGADAGRLRARAARRCAGSCGGRCGAAHAARAGRSGRPRRRRTSCWSWCSKTCIGATHRPWTGSRCWRGGANGPGCW